MVWFMLLGLNRKPEGFVRIRATKMLRTFAIWVVIYAVSTVAAAMIKGESPLAALVKWLPFNGTFGQLWFLPWAAVVTGVIASIAKTFTLDTRSYMGLTISFVLCAAISIVCLSIWTAKPFPLVVLLCILYVPSVLVGILIYQSRHSKLSLIASAVAICVFGVAMNFLGYDGTSQLIYGAPIMALSLLLVTPALPLSKRLGSMSMDIFLVHILAIAAVGGPLGISTTTASGGLIVVGLTLVLAILMQNKIGAYLR
jgi:hypothetical protein